ncbi:glycosyltransferase family A protein [Bacillus sp. m3-13]|uniref:glycosyltransferase family A protein n=1 Tax=Bacillus sp. m3-13 TaxID=406124 RepID=UPI0001E89DD0|nr:glycosyltransferase family A protein [Bacillus sp. m3-13]
MNNVSVIIPTHNRPHLLLLALQSIEEQTEKPDEVMVVMDGEDRETERFLNGYENDHFTFRYLKIPKSKGACYARNLGAENAAGDILMFLDDDDTWEPGKIKSQLKEFEVDQDVGLVYSGKLVVYNTNRKKVIRRIPATVKGNLYPKIFEDNYIGTTSSVAVKKEVFQQAGGFDNNLPAMQDYDLWIRCCERTKVAHDNQYNVRYTIAKNAANQISGKSENHHRALTYLFDKYRKVLEGKSPTLQRRFKSSRFLHLSKAVHRNNYLYSLKYSLKSIYYYPNIKAVALFLPPFLLAFISLFQPGRRN